VCDDLVRDSVENGYDAPVREVDRGDLAEVKM